MKRVFILVSISYLLLSVFITQPCYAQDDNIIVFPDDNLKHALTECGVIADENGNITQSALESITGSLNLSCRNILNLNGIQHLINIQSLNLSGNNITDLSFLLSMPGLLTVDLTYNYLDTGTDSEDTSNIQTLIQNGVSVQSVPQKTPAAEISLSQTSVTVFAGAFTDVEAEVLPADAANKQIKWQSSDETTAAVSNGHITGVCEGSAQIIVTSEDGFASNTINVTVERDTFRTQDYAVQNGLVLNVQDETSLQDFFNKFANAPEHLKLYTGSDTQFTGQIITTGLRLKLIIGDVLHEEASIIVKGDTSGDGLVSIADYTLARLHLLGIKDLAGDFLTAGDANADGQISIIDYTLMRLHILGIKDLYTGEENDPYAGIDIDSGFFDSFFNNSALIGDSISDGLRMYTSRQRGDEPGFLGNLRFFTVTSYNLNYACGYSTERSIIYNGKKMLPQDALKAMGAEKVFLMIGMNDVFRSIDSNITKYEQLISNIRAKNPDIEIYILGITPIVKSAERSGFTNSNADAFNSAISAMCERVGTVYIDVSALKNGTNGLPAAYSSDGFVHLSTAGLKVYVDILRNTAKRYF